MNRPISKTPEADLSSPFPEANPNGQDTDALRAEVFVYVGQEIRAKYVIEHGEYLVGRDESCHIPIDADRVSRHHARITFSAYELVIEDLGSSNGVFIDGIQVQLPTRIGPDQEVQIGGSRLFVRLNEATAKQIADALWDTDLGLAPVREQLTGKRYKVITTVARGGMGVILHARDLRIRRSVAMKVMKSGAQFSRENVLRFIDEAQLTGQLDHPNIVPVYELGIDADGETFYTMKYVRGITLDEVLRGLRYGREEIVAKYPLSVLLTIFQKVCDAVAFAHAKGVVHRDLKPENIMIGTYGEVFVMDWGLAKQMATVIRPEHPDNAAPSDSKVDAKPREPKDPLRGFQTLHGVVIGTPPYVSPEQARGELDAIEPRSDLYVLGGILYAILTLRSPVTGATLEEILEKIIGGWIKPPVYFNQTSRPSQRPTEQEGADAEIVLAHCPGRRIPEGLSAVAMKALQLEPADRYQSVQEMQNDLVAYQSGFAPKAERAGLWRQMLLFGARHKREVGLLFACALVFNVIVVAFIVQLTQEKNRAVASELREKAKEAELARAVSDLTGTAPTFASEAATLLDQKKPDEALEKIDFAIEQVPNAPGYHSLRGNILQSLLRFDEAAAAYEDELRRNPKDKSARENLTLTKKLIAEIGTEGQVTPPILRELHAALVSQKRVGEALGVLDEIGHDRQLFFNTWKAEFEKRGLKDRFVNKDDDNTLNIDLSRVPVPDLRKVRGAPVSGLNLDDTRIVDISALKGLPLNTLSLSHTMVRDLSPLAGMPLHNLNLEGTQINKLAGISGLPLKSLRLGGTRIEHLGPLKGMKLEQLSIAGCRNITDLTPLAGMPLQKVDLSRSGISDLRPLANASIRELNLEGCPDLVDLHPLMEMTSLDSVVIPAHCKDIEFLRNHPSIKRLSYTRLTQPVYEFWEQWDAKRPPPAEATASEKLQTPPDPNFVPVDPVPVLPQPGKATPGKSSER